MNLRELLPVIQASVSLEEVGKRKKYDSKSEIPDKWMSHAVTSVTSDENGILIMLSKPKKQKSLEELGYSFEVGV